MAYVKKKHQAPPGFEASTWNAQGIEPPAETTIF